ncbi:hypothetical protein [Ahrensia marina]|uniref:hypothetical protein n=1 Tax=Ahrensia marina TaxID=1514904 RepID=UPI000AE4DD7C|nr:hypothetical protein [Ahrensia marina]
MSKRAQKHRANEKGYEHYTKVLRPTCETPAWRALSSSAQALYPWIKFQWRGTEHNNNGKIKLSVRQAAEAMGVGSTDTTAKAFQCLQAKGFIVVKEPGRLGIDGEGKSPEYEITELAMPGKDNAGRPLQPRKLYLHWSENNDYNIVKANPNNPNGRNGKKISHPENKDGPIPKTGTELESLSRKLGWPVQKTGTNDGGVR